MNHVIYVFLDESGDLGFKRKSSKVFVVAYVITTNPENMRIRVKRLRKRLKSTRRRKRIVLNEFKFNRDSKKIRMILFNLLKELDFEIGYVVIDKNYVKYELRDKPTVLYNYLTVHFVITNILSGYNPDKIIFTLDKSLPRSSRVTYDYYFTNKLHWRSLIQGNKKFSRHEVKHVDSRGEVCIQVADYIAGAAYRKFEFSDPTYYNMIKDKIVFRNSWGNIEW